MHNTNRYDPDSGAHLRLSALRAFRIASLLLFAFAGQVLAQQPGGVIQTTAPDTNNPRVTESLIDSSIPEDPALLRMLEPYRAPVRELDVVIGELDGELRKARVGAGSLGNFVTDALRAEAGRTLGKPVVLMVTNSGGLRKNSIAPGELRVRDIFELLPFENALIRVDMTGEQVLKLLSAVLLEHDAQSGAHVTYRFAPDNKPELVGAKFVDARGREQSIKPKTIYRVVTIDYLKNLKSGNYSILGEGRNITPLGITMRNALLSYVKSEKAKGRAVHAKLDNRFTQIGPGPTEASPQ